MKDDQEANWWAFTIDPQGRAQKIQTGTSGEREVNPPGNHGRLELDYSGYLGLETLLASQTPSSMVPDERVFIITHQLFELVFKMMIFDLAVVAKTLRHVLEIAAKEEFAELYAVSSDNDLWRPALTAAARLRYSTQRLLPSFIGYLEKKEGREESFDTLEFAKFRPYLPPASGFQTAQFRLIQRALGKGNLLSVRLFPGQEYRKLYEGVEDQGPVRVTDPLILRGATAIVEPSADLPWASLAQLDDLAHGVLTRIAEMNHLEPEASGLRKISADDVASAMESFRRILAHHRREQERAGVKPLDAVMADMATDATLQGDLAKAVERENRRRDGLMSARAGAFYLHHVAPRSHLVYVLSQLVSVDEDLHGTKEEAFLSRHLKLAKDRIGELKAYAARKGFQEPPSGTGGGGIEYLAYSHFRLVPLFPALVAYRDLEAAPCLSWVE